MTQWYLFEQPNAEHSQLLMQTIDAINARFGRETIQFAVAGLEKPWAMRSEMRSNRWMTDWNEIPVVRV
ncbi:MAG: DUF4113 domain-containing protein [Acaryochloridaceae cyanobacterium RU_4_10]|nr:DUF4113 domain-containing protein [Acaryochloridaceae cyanobacterium RU_4_10]